jgi:hypothetical protein
VAIAIVSGNRGTATEKTSDTSLVLTPSAALAAGNYGLLAVVVDNVGTVEGETATVSVTDSQGHTWTRLREQSQGTTALAGVTCALFLAPLTNGLGTGDTITITLTANGTAKGAGLAELSVGAGNTLELSTGGANGTNEAAATSYSVALSGLTSVAGLYVGMTAAENETGVALDTAYTELAFGEIGSGIAGGSATNVIAHVGTLANTSTGDTFDASVAGADRATILIRLEEAAAAGPQTVSPGLIDQAGQVFAPQVNQQVQLGLIDQPGQVFAPSLIQAVSPGMIDQAGVLFAPTVHQALALPLIDQSGVLFSPSVNQAAAQTVELELIDRTGAVFGVTITGDPPAGRLYGMRRRKRRMHTYPKD